MSMEEQRMVRMVAASTIKLPNSSQSAWKCYVKVWQYFVKLDNQDDRVVFDDDRHYCSLCLDAVKKCRRHKFANDCNNMTCMKKLDCLLLKIRLSRKISRKCISLSSAEELMASWKLSRIFCLASQNLQKKFG